ncbi:double-stranded RNA-binding protein 1 isoform X2 [Daucus carota subsp. sativus]|uniref:double-stranded RNA-binding protein 1 isoform X2 n=1 Tax=Daucus carota subsp. sativus TaxID=79200 RepID=UPI0007F03B91|nr:PREDICTED: double-stranded RNA-binding protein 1-like isoform X2 [Daucus carota subsp. sativus]
MYKTKLQELCQQKKWALPKYSYVKEGPDHNPSFKASVVVKGVTFDTEIASNSSKDAQNDAARLAVHHFTASEPEGETKTGQPGIELHQAGKLQSNATEFKNDERNQYKLMLQTYAQRNKLGMPVYSSDKKGPPHAPCFKATVYVEGHPYDSPGTYKTLKEAEHAAAQVALLSFTTDTFQKNCPPLYKNILQELAQSEGFIFPVYKTENSGEPHNPSFISTVEVEGEMFQGTVAKSKKQAESNAARVAYTAFMERKRSRTANSSSSSSAHETLEVKAGKQCIQEKDDYEDCPTESLPDYSKYSLQKFIESPASADMDNTTGNSDSHFSPESIRLSSTGGQPSSIITPPDLSSLTIRSPTLKKSDETESYLLCNRYRVYTRIPDIDFPKGTILLPIAEDQWVAVSIELPN